MNTMHRAMDSMNGNGAARPLVLLAGDRKRPRHLKRPRALGASPSRARSDGTQESLGRNLDFMRLLWAVDHGLTRISRRMEQTFGVTGPQRMVVRLVGQRPGITSGDLARTLHVHPSTLTEVLRRLEQRGVLTRTTDPADARRAQFRLTRKGVTLDALREGTTETYVRNALGLIPDRELSTAARVLDRIARTLADAS